LDWSPEQMASWLKITHPEDEYNQVSPETIYYSLFVRARGVLKKELLRHLRSKRSMRHSRPVDPNGDRRGHMKDAVSIRQRPAAVEDRAVPGHWEGDLLFGPNNTYFATLVERQTRNVMLAKVASKDTRTVVNALINQTKTLPKELYKSLTWDRDARHREVSLADAVADDAACEQHFLIRGVGIGHRESEFSAGRTTAHRHSVSARRRHSAGGVALYCGFDRHRTIGVPGTVPEQGKHDDQAQHSGG